MSRRFAFFQQAMLALLGSKDLFHGLVNIFGVLREYLPIDAITFDSHLEEESAMMIHYVVTGDGFFQLKHTVALDPEANEFVRVNRRKLQVLHLDHKSFNRLLPPERCGELEQYVACKERSYMAGMLHVEGHFIGALVCFGNGPESLTEEHTRLMKMILPACAMAMHNLLEMQDLCQKNVLMLHEQNRLRRELAVFTQGEVVGAQSGLRDVVDAVRHLADKDTPVLILGETGTGKELVADAIQRHSTRCDKPFVKVNCGALSDTLLDSELFGHERGAFTGAVSMHLGRFEQANGGTLFLDEVGELSPQAQVRLLRVLQDGAFERTGGHRRITVNVRVIAATHRDLHTMCRQGLFRVDLFHRLNVFPVHIPPLRKRREDIPLLVLHLAERTARRLGLPRPAVPMESMDRLMQHSWPGNVRELENLVERAIIMSPGKPLDLTRLIAGDREFMRPVSSGIPDMGTEPVTASGFRSAEPRNELVSRDMMERFMEEKLREWQQMQSAGDGLAAGDDAHASAKPADMGAQICEALAVCKGRVYGPDGAAALLGMNHNTLYSRIRKLGLKAGRHWRTSCASRKVEQSAE